MKKTAWLLFFLAFFLAACHLPLVDKEVTVPFLEKKPDQAINNMLAVMSQKVKSARYNFKFTIKSDVDLSRLNWPKNSRLKAEIKKFKNLANLSQPKVLGLSKSFASEEESFNLSDDKASASSPLPFNSKEQPISPMPILDNQPANRHSSQPPEEIPLSLSRPRNLKVAYQIDGLFDNQAEKKASEATIKVNVDLDDWALKTKVDLRVIGEMAYLKIYKNSVTAVLDKMLPGLVGEWLEIDSQKIAELQRELIDSQPLLADQLPSFDVKQNKQRIERIRQEAKDLLSKYKIFSVKQRLKDQKIDGYKCYHYQIALNKDNLTKFLEGVINIATLEFNQDNPVLVKGLDQRPEFKEELEKLKKALVKAEGNFWIDKKDFYLRQFDFSFNIDVKKLGAPTSAKSYLLALNFSGNYKDFNHSFKVEKPPKTKSFVDLLKQEISKSLVLNRDRQRLADISSIRLALKKYYQEVGRYPEKLEEGGTLTHGYKTYMLVVPKNPVPGGLPYTYTAKDGGKSYVLSYQLEKGFSIFPGGVALCATPQKLASDCVQAEAGQESSDNDDADSDGLSNKLEKTIYFTDPLNPDTDGDGYLDGDEVKNGFNPRGPGRLQDADKDGLPAEAERAYRTSDHNPDTDGDGYSDYEEVLGGFNPRGPGRLAK